MRPVLTPTEAAALDRASEERGIATADLMERAGWHLSRAAADMAGGAYGARVVVVCGKGNNGGDGLVAARHLEHMGARATVVLLADPAGLEGLPARNLARLREIPGLRPLGVGSLARELDRADVVIDAVFGTGFRGIAEGDAAGAIAAMNASGVPVLSADIPSGVDGATGAVPGEAVEAAVTVTFGAEKPGLLLHPGAAYAGLVEVADIGFPSDLVVSDLAVVEADDVVALLPERAPDTHKREAGHVLVVGGSARMTGAVGLCAAAAYRMGAGLVTVAVPSGILPVVQMAVPEAVFLPLPSSADGGVAPDALEVLWERLGDFGAIAVGPGLGTSEETAAFARHLVAAAPNGLVVDADGLNAFVGRLEEFDDRGSADLVLTPHVGEFARLTGQTSADVEVDRVAAARELARRIGATVLLKGSCTVIAEPTGTARINPTGSSVLATGGTGDVLTGAVAALMARGLGSYDAATAGAYLHGIAGLIAARSLGEGTTAGDVCECIPDAVEEVLGS